MIPEIHKEPVGIHEKLVRDLRNGGASPTEAGFGAHVYDFICEVSRQKRERDCRAALHQDYYNGEQWKVLNPHLLIIQPDPNIEFVVNNFRVVVNHAESAIMALEMRSEAMAAGDSQEDRLSAEVVNAMLDDHYYRNNRITEEREALLACLNGGDHFMRVSYDENEMGTVVLDPDELQAFETILERDGYTHPAPIMQTRLADGRIRAVYHIGGTREHHLPAENVFPEAGASRWEDITRVAVVDYPSVRSARLAYPKRADRINPMSVENTRGSSQGVSWDDWSTRMSRDQNSQLGTTFNEMAQVCKIVHYYEKNDNGTWDWAVLTGRHLEFTIHTERGLPSHGIVKYSYEPSGFHRMWSNSLGNAIRPLAYTHNALLNQYVRYLRESLKDILLMPDGGGKGTPVTNRHRAVYRYPIAARTPPQYLSQNPNTLRIWLEAANFFLGQMWEVGGIGAAMRGVAGDRMSGVAVVQQTQNNQTPLMRVRQMLGDTIVEKDRLALSMMQQFYSVPRLLAISGDFSETGVKLASSANVTAGTSVRLLKIDVTPETQAARRDLFVQMFQAGLGAPEAEGQRRAMLHYIHTGREIATTPPEERLAEQQQIDEIRLIMEGKVEMAPEVITPDGEMERPPRLIVTETGESIFRPYQIHEIHARVLKDKLNGPNLPEYFRGLLEI